MKPFMMTADELPTEETARKETKNDKKLCSVKNERSNGPRRNPSNMRIMDMD
jgi:hypothetical protein